MIEPSENSILLPQLQHPQQQQQHYHHPHRQQHRARNHQISVPGHQEQQQNHHYYPQQHHQQLRQQYDDQLLGLDDEEGAHLCHPQPTNQYNPRMRQSSPGRIIKEIDFKKS